MNDKFLEQKLKSFQEEKDEMVNFLWFSKGLNVKSLLSCTILKKMFDQ